MKIGIVYLLTNPYMPGLVKIGMTAQSDIKKRMKELYTTGVPAPFVCEYACEVDSKECTNIEQALHTAFEPQRVNKNREYFKIKVEQAKAILELFHHKEVTEVVSEDIEEELTPEDKDASEKAKEKRPPLNYYKMKMHDGDILKWKDDPSITVTIISERKVSYKGEEVSLSALSAQLKGYKVKHIQPTPHWLYEGRLLSDIYDETYPIEE